jgi:hypothetical protein
VGPAKVRSSWARFRRLIVQELFKTLQRFDDMHVIRMQQRRDFDL